jgi:hypothetical protein
MTVEHGTQCTNALVAVLTLHSNTTLCSLTLCLFLASSSSAQNPDGTKVAIDGGSNCAKRLGDSQQRYNRQNLTWHNTASFPVERPQHTAPRLIYGTLTRFKHTASKTVAALNLRSTYNTGQGWCTPCLSAVQLMNKTQQWYKHVAARNPDD